MFNGQLGEKVETLGKPGCSQLGFIKIGQVLPAYSLPIDLKVFTTI